MPITPRSSHEASGTDAAAFHTCAHWTLAVKVHSCSETHASEPCQIVCNGFNSMLVNSVEPPVAFVSQALQHLQEDIYALRAQHHWLEPLPLACSGIYHSWMSHCSHKLSSLVSNLR